MVAGRETERRPEPSQDPEFLTVQLKPDSDVEVFVGSFSNEACGGPIAGYVQESVLCDNQAELILAAAWVETEYLDRLYANFIAETFWHPESAQCEQPASLEIVKLDFMGHKTARTRFDWQYDLSTGRVASAALVREEQSHLVGNNEEPPMILMGRQSEEYDSQTQQILHQVWGERHGGLGWTEMESTWKYDTGAAGQVARNRQWSEEERIMETDDLVWDSESSATVSYAWQTPPEAARWQADRIRKLNQAKELPVRGVPIDVEAVLQNFYLSIARGVPFFASSFNRAKMRDFLFRAA